MKSTIYLNGVLTVIAICLIILCMAVTGIFPKSYANDRPKANGQKFISLPLNPDGSLNVKVVNEAIDVNIDKVGGYYTDGKIKVKVED